MKILKAYLPLVFLLIVGLGLFVYFGYNRQLQILTVAGMGAVYVLWGVVYHRSQEELHLRLVLEYLAIATVASLGVIFLLLRA